MTVPDSAGSLEARLRRALTAALRARDLTAAAALRSALGAIGNAEAVPAPAAGPAAPGAPAAGDGPHIAGAVAGLAAGEAERLRLSPAQVQAIVQAEIDERLAAAAQYEQAGHADRAARLAAEAQALAVVAASRDLP
jgi:uncharacterized protein YqeY